MEGWLLTIFIVLGMIVVLVGGVLIIRLGDDGRAARARRYAAAQVEARARARSDAAIVDQVGQMVASSPAVRAPRAGVVARKVASSTPMGMGNVEPARWTITYEDAYGEITTRTITVLRLDLRSKVIDANCSLRMDVRTFKINQIASAVDADTGRRVNLDAWVEAIRTKRRALRAC